MSSFPDNVAQLTYEKFKKLPKRGKPQDKKEWTLLASIAMSNGSESKFELVALATGTKCLGYSFLSKKGDVVHDSHAEILVRRTFKRFLLGTMSSVLSGKPSNFMVFNPSKGFALKPGVQFHLFVSHTPCGDASIFPKDSLQDPGKSSVECYDDRSVKKPKLEHNVLIKGEGKSSAVEDLQSSETKLENDIFRTGAKCVADGQQDPKAPGVGYHVTGTLRTKPGRGDPTWSMSCSDKMACWNICGIQGALITHVLQEPIYFTSIIIGKCPFNLEAFQRAIVHRTYNIDHLPMGYRQADPKLFQSKLSFPYCKEMLESSGQKKSVPCSAAVIWNKTMGNNVDVCVNGRKQGIIKKDYHKPSSWSTVCKRNIFEEFLSVLKNMPTVTLPDLNKSYTKNYWEMKQSAKEYQQAKCKFLELFDGWMRKSEDLQKFSL